MSEPRKITAPGAVAAGDPSVHSRIARLVRALHPVRTEFELVRIGSANDGGYLVPDDLAGIAACFSPGVDVNASFELDLLARWGIGSHLADYSVAGPPMNFVPKSFTRKFIGATNDDVHVTLDAWLRACEGPAGGRDFLLQMDIEGAEYAALADVEEETLQAFRIVVIEVHGIEHWGDPVALDRAERMFARLTRRHQVVHNHPNNCCGFVELGTLLAPSTIELTLLRRDRGPTAGFCRQFPHPLDAPNLPERPDLVLPRDWYATEGPGDSDRVAAADATAGTRFAAAAPDGADVSVLIPTRGRPDSLLRLLRSLGDHANVEVLVALDDDDPAAGDAMAGLRVEAPRRAKLRSFVWPRPRTLGALINRLAAESTGRYLFFLADDYVVTTPDWSAAILAASRRLPHGMGVLRALDPAGPGFAAHPIVSREACAVLGYCMSPIFPFWFIDTWWDEIGELMQVKVAADVAIVNPDGKGATHGMVDLDFWAAVFEATRPLRVEAALKLARIGFGDRGPALRTMLELLPQRVAHCARRVAHLRAPGFVATWERRSDAPPSARYREVKAEATRLLPGRRYVAPGSRPTLDAEAWRVGQAIEASLREYQAGRFDAAADAASRAAGLDPACAAAWNNLGAALNSRGRWDEAIEACARAVALDPGFTLAVNNLAYAVRNRDWTAA